MGDELSPSQHTKELSVFAQDIVAIATRADREAFARLFQHFAPRIKSYMVRLGATHPRAEDLSQEAMLSVWRKATLFDPRKADASTWIFTIARNLRIDLIRRERRPEVNVDDLPEAADPSLSAEDVLLAAQGAERVRAALKELPTDQAEVMRLAFFDDLPHSAIARRLGLPLGTVKSRLRLAFAKLRGALRQEQFGPEEP